MNVFFLLLSIFASLAYSAEKPNAAVIPFCGNEGITDRQAAVLSERFQTELMGNDKFTMLDRQQMDRILQEQGFQQSGACDTEDCTVQMGKLLGVDKMFAGCASQVAGVITLNARMIDVETGRIEAQYAVDTQGGLDKALTTSTKELADRFSGTEVHRSRGNVLWWIAGGILAAGGIAATVILSTSETQTDTLARSRSF